MIRALAGVARELWMTTMVCRLQAELPFSSNPVGMAAPLSLTNVRSRRRLRSCSAWAINFLPVLLACARLAADKTGVSQRNVAQKTASHAETICRDRGFIL
jgi:hypothetical protein